ncbi:MAG: YvcK family protein [Anaerolineae bacterium]|nr:YvcK family protein [Anaerolineae bacterium]
MIDQPNVVVLGGGAGAVQVLVGLRGFAGQLTGILAVTDTGRSTGKVRYLGQMPAPGDIRNGLGTLAGEESTLAQLIQYRLHIPHAEVLDGVAFGNLMLMALMQMTGDFVAAIDILRDWLGIQDVRVLPVTTVSTHLCAELENGEIVEEELNVRAMNKPPIKRLFLQNPEARAYPACVEAIQAADLIVIAAGGLFTSVLACLVFEEITTAIRHSRAATVYICNTTVQPGQTDGYSLADHVRQIVQHVGHGVLDYVILNTLIPDEGVRAQYAAEGLQILIPTSQDLLSIEGVGVRAVLAEVAQITHQKRNLWQKQDSLHHDPVRVAAVLKQILAG